MTAVMTTLTLDGRRLPKVTALQLWRLRVAVLELNRDFEEHGWHSFLSDRFRVWAVTCRRGGVLGGMVDPAGETMDADTPEKMRAKLAERVRWDAEYEERKLEGYRPL